MPSRKHPPILGKEVVQLLASDAGWARYGLSALIVLDSSPGEGFIQINEIEEHCIVADAPCRPAVAAAADTDAAGVGFGKLHSGDDV